jgi:hypothetical protein
MTFSVTKSRPFRSLGLYKYNGKHAAPKGSVAAPRPSAEGASHHPAHAVGMPRLTGPHAEGASVDTADIAATAIEGEQQAA